MRRVVVTGISTLTTLGDTRETWEGILDNQCSVSELPESWRTLGSFRTQGISLISKDVPVVSRTTRFTEMAALCAEEAVHDAGLNPADADPCRFGVIMGSGMGGLTMIEEQVIELNRSGNRRIHPFGVSMTMPNALTGHLAIQYKAKGPNLTLSTACSSANHAIGLAYEAILLGKADVMLTGGSESLITPVVFSAFDKMRVMAPSHEMCRPFSRNRRGFILGEGAAVLLLEELGFALKRGAEIYAEVVGYSACSDAYDMVMPDPDGAGVAFTIKQAIRQAGLSIQDIDYINAHGTGTPAGDAAEARGMQQVFGSALSSIPVSSIKGAVGHTLGASAAVEAVVSILTLKNQIIPPTVGCDQVDEALGIHVIAQRPQPASVQTILSNSFGFGGNNSTLILRKYQQ